MAVMAIPNFERFFRQAAGLDVDKDDLKRYSDFVNAKLHDLLLMAQPAAKANARDVIEPWDLPITKGLQECIRRYEKMEQTSSSHPSSSNSPNVRSSTSTTARRPGSGSPRSSAASASRSRRASGSSIPSS